MSRVTAAQHPIGHIRRVSPRILGAFFIIVTVLGACSNPAPTTTPDPPPAGPAAAPKLSTELVRGCQQSRTLGQGGPSQGEPAIDFTLRDIHGKACTLSKLLAEKPVVLIFGSFT
jgi:cytochrome oxidase Cu insertion factor (SCO1/SenC/PrrC family)